MKLEWGPQSALDISAWRTRKQLTGTADFVLRISNHFVPLGNPAHSAGQGEHASEQIHWNANGALHDARVEVDVGVQLA